jgi:zinc-ribbon domain
VICPKCGEDNSDDFRFCGMCGTVLENRRASRLENRAEPRRPASAPGLDPLSAFPPAVPLKVANTPDMPRPVAADNTIMAASQRVPPISGPSMLGLDQSDANQLGRNQIDRNASSPNQLSRNHPSMDSLRANSFPSFGSFVEPERPKTGRRVALMVVLLAALGGAGWWVYTNYLGAAEGRKLAASPSSAGDTITEKPSTSGKPVEEHGVQSPASDANSSANSSQPASAEVPKDTSEKPNVASDSAQATQESDTKNTSDAKTVTPEPIAPTPTTPAPAAATKAATVEKKRPKHEPVVKPAKTSTSPAVAADTGDAAFRKAEAYLYGRGVAENCDEAVKNLKVASSKSNAKARSAFGTMYATGHCVPRDLPTSYLWFALALRIDPNNQILEKDLNAVWNQMTPPERQMATRMKE